MKRIFISLLFLLSPLFSHAEIVAVGTPYVSDPLYYSLYSNLSSYQLASFYAEVDDTDASSTSVILYSDESCLDQVSIDVIPLKTGIDTNLYTIFMLAGYQTVSEVHCVSVSTLDSTESVLNTYSTSSPDSYLTFAYTDVNVSTTTIIQVQDTTQEPRTYALYSFLVLASFTLGFIITAWTLHLFTA